MDHKLLKQLGIPNSATGLPARSPIDGSILARVQVADEQTIARTIDAAEEAFRTWRLAPAPRRGEFVRRLGQAAR